MELEKIRKEIDSIDWELLHLFNRRFELALMAKRHKKEIHDPSREAEILKKLGHLSSSFRIVRPDFIEKMFRDIFQESRRIQKEAGTPMDFKSRR